MPTTVKKFTQNKITILLCLQSLIFFIGGIYLHLEQRLPIVDIFLTSPLVGMYILLKYIIGRQKGIQLRIIFATQCILVIAISILMPYSAWFFLSSFGSHLLIYAIKLFRNKYLVFIHFTIIYTIMYFILMYFNFNGLVYRRIILAFLLILMAAFAFLLLESIHNTTMQRFLEESKETNKRVVRIAEVSERAKVAKKLHETLTQGALTVVDRLNTISVNLTNENIAEVHEVVSFLLPHARNVMQESRKVMDELRLIPNNDVDFISSLDEIIKTIKISKKVDITYEVNKEIMSTIPSPVTEQLIFIIRDALANAINNSRAYEVSILIEGTRQNLSVKIIDNGSGYDLTSFGTIYSGSGIVGIKERVELINGNMQIISELNKGTKMHITINM